MRRRRKPVGRVLFEELTRMAVGLVLAVIAGLIAYNLILNAFAEAMRQTIAP